MTPPILRDLPEEFESARLLIRAPRPGDGAEANAAAVETFESLHLWMPWARECPSLADTETYVRQAYAKWIAREDFALFLFLKGTGTFVGASGLHPKNWEVPRFEIGYWCRARFEGQGYITEAVRAIATFGFETMGALCIDIRCDSRNLRSRRVAERAGFRLDGELRYSGHGHDGTLRNELRFSLLAEEYAVLKPTWEK
jgi:RimJ/RimL family protein N-acetyltransferase